MRVAVCLSGMPRSFKRTSGSLIKNLIEPYNADVFISTWRSEMKDDMYPETDSAEALIEAFKPVKFDIEIFNETRLKSFETNRFRTRADWDGRAVGRMIPMYYKIMLADLHRFMHEEENQFTYDLVVRCRTDLLFEAPVILQQPARGKIYFPDNGSQNNVNDQFWYADSATASDIGSLYLSIPRLWHTGILIHGELLLYGYMVMRKLVAQLVTDVSYRILR